MRQSKRFGGGAWGEKRWDGSMGLTSRSALQDAGMAPNSIQAPPGRS